MSSNPTTRILYTWHLLNGLIHLLFESTYVYNCFTAYITIPLSPPSLPLPHHHHHPTRFFLTHRDRLYGNAYSDHLSARPWQAVAAADSRYAGIDLTTLSLEIITVVLAGPLSLYVARSIRRDVLIAKRVSDDDDDDEDEREGRRKRMSGISGGTWFWAVVLASGELYGGLMNFLPEWLSGCESLDTGDPVHLWFHIVFFNAIWAFFPLWVLMLAYSEIGDAFGALTKTEDGAYQSGRDKSSCVGNVKDDKNPVREKDVIENTITSNSHT